MTIDPDARGDDCEACPLAERRAFLREAAALVAGAVLALGASPARAAAFTIDVARAARVTGDLRTYPLPATDGATIDRDAEVIVVRFQGRVFAFALSCPHQHTALRWSADKTRFECPKHHSKYQADGTFISGRATRNMDRFAVRRSGDTVVVDTATLYRADKNPDEWRAATVGV